MVFGAGKSGLGSVALLEKNGYEVILVDDKSAMNSSDAIKYLDEISIFIKSPGIPYVDLVKKAFEKNIEVIDEIELSYRELKKRKSKAKIIGITGTNGKTTTTAKTAELLEYGGYKSIACGNIGKPFSEVVMEGKEYDYIVIELSSFQLENIKTFKSDISMIINLTPDHIDRYSTIDEYYDTKINVGKNQSLNEKFIINLQDKETMKRLNMINGAILGISTNRDESAFMYEHNGKIVCENKEILESDKLSLKGKHNLENMLFVATVGKIVGISDEKIAEFLYNAKPIEHRLEEFLRVENTVFINDSKGTNSDSTKFALEAFPQSILVCGGKDKHLEMKPLAVLIKKYAKEVYLIGENRNQIIEALKNEGYSSEKIFDVENIENCTKILKAKLNLEENNIILFSPATSSYDQFLNFEDRGRKFKSIINEYFGG